METSSQYNLTITRPKVMYKQIKNNKRDFLFSNFFLHIFLFPPHFMTNKNMPYNFTKNVCPLMLFVLRYILKDVVVFISLYVRIANKNIWIM